MGVKLHGREIVRESGVKVAAEVRCFGSNESMVAVEARRVGRRPVQSD